MFTQSEGRTQSFVSRIVVLTLLVLTWSYTLPLLTQFFRTESYSRIFNAIFYNERAGGAFRRTLAFAAIASIAEVFLGFVGALALRKITADSKTGRGLGLLLAPALIGNLGAAFLFKVQMMNSTWFEALVATRSIVVVEGTILSIELWQYGSLFLYLFWLRLQRIPATTTDFGSVMRLNRREVVRDIFWPHCRNLAALLILIGFLIASHEYTKSQLIFRPSPGTGTELASHWLGREYQRNLSTFGATRSRDETFKDSAGFVLTILAASACCIWVALSVLSAGIRANVRIPLRSMAKRKWERKGIASVPGGWILIGLICLPVFGALRYLRPGPVGNSSELAVSVLLSLSAGFLAFLVAAGFGISARISWPEVLQSFNTRSLWLFISLFLLQAVPGISIGLCGYEWFSRFTDVPAQHYAIWMIGQALLVLPMLGSFVLWIHFQVDTRELEFQTVSKLSLLELASWSFLRRFKLEYALVIIFAVSFIWNEDTLNRVMSDTIPSIVHRLGTVVTGRAASSSESTTLVMISIAISLVMVSVWNRVLSKAFNAEDRT